MGMDSDPAARNVLGVIASHPELARDGIDLRKFGHASGRRLGARMGAPGMDRARRRSHRALAAHTREHILSELPKTLAIAECTIQFFKGSLDSYKEEIEFFGSFPSV
jgi:NAD-reducing hydrogenase large subunit